MERLQKILARAGHGSRRSCEDLLRAGRVKVNGEMAKLGDSADSNTDTITVDDEPIRFERYRYIMLNKPKGVLSSTEDGEDRETVRDLIDEPGHLYPIGRLDKNSEGLILMTNDGMLANRLTHPRYGHSKTYRVWVERKPSNEDLIQWRKGVMLDDKMTAPCGVTVKDDSKYTVELQIIMREGRKRQIRRVAELLGHRVRRLQRVKIGPISLKRVEPGEWRDLTEGEVRALYKAAKVPHPKDRHHKTQSKKRPSSGGRSGYSGNNRPGRSRRGTPRAGKR